jgi:hypothetical protein
VRGNLPKLPSLLERKLYKTGQTRGADDDEIYQNRVSRNSTVLVPYRMFEKASTPPGGSNGFENGFIALIQANDYFAKGDIKKNLAERRLVLGVNALVFYETREQWNLNPPAKLRWSVAKRRKGGLGGKFIARISANTALNGGRISQGFNTTANKGAGIRGYEYASSQTIKNCRIQLEALFWLCSDAPKVAKNNGMTETAITLRRAAIFEMAEKSGLLDQDRLKDARILNRSGRTTCPLCLEEFSSEGFFTRLTQAEGREVADLTVTHLNLFHVQELRYGLFNHRPYNLGWGHHHCNVVAKDAGIFETLAWMRTVLDRNAAQVISQMQETAEPG